MKVSAKISLLALVSAIGVLVTACSKNDGPQAPAENGFDKTAMLTQYADQLIIPGYTAMQQQLQALETALVPFLTDPSADQQAKLKPVFTAAYLQCERLAVYQLGPAETELLNNFLNTFPANVSSIENNILSGNANLTLNSALDQQGFPALDYLLFSKNALQQFGGETATKRKKYVQDVLARMKLLVNKVSADWNGNYRAQFIANTRTDVGSPIGYLINQFAYELDQLKGPRIGWPFGKQSGGRVYADKCEGYYAGISVELAVENLSSLKKAYTAAGSGKGISDYLIALKQESLNTAVLKQFDNTLDKLKSIPDPLSLSLTNQKELVDATYKEIQSLLTLLKTDVASATSVRINYQDNDGD